MSMTVYSKAITALIMGIVSIVALWWPPIAQYASAEIVGTVAGLLTPLLVYLIPNKPAQI